MAIKGDQILISTTCSSVPDENRFDSLPTMYIMRRLFNISSRISLDELVVRKLAQLICRQQVRKKFLWVAVSLIAANITASSIDHFKYIVRRFRRELDFCFFCVRKGPDKLGRETTSK